MEGVLKMLKMSPTHLAGFVPVVEKQDKNKGGEAESKYMPQWDSNHHSFDGVCILYLYF